MIHKHQNSIEAIPLFQSLAVVFRMVGGYFTYIRQVKGNHTIIIASANVQCVAGPNLNQLAAELG